VSVEEKDIGMGDQLRESGTGGQSKGGNAKET
jgi:hypothetical protein